MFNMKTFIYNCETCVLPNEQRGRKQSTKMGFFQSTRFDRNVYFRAKVDGNEINSVLSNNRMKYNEYSLRMPNDRFPKLALSYRPTGKRG